MALIMACSANRTRRQLGSENPLERAEGIVRVSENSDASAIPKLVDLLEDSDGAVRMYAILALRRMCGVDFGYRFYDAPADRYAAVQRWRQAIRCGQLKLRSPEPAGTHAEFPSENAATSEELGATAR
jgi:hypothetical protein